MPSRATVQLFLAGLSVFSIAPAYVFADDPLPIVKVAIQEGGDERITPEEYDAKPGRHPGDFLRKYGATVKIKCPFAWSTGNLVLRNDLVVTVAHAFQKRDDSNPNDVKCSPVLDADMGQCYVQKMDDGGLGQKYPIIASTIRHPLTNECIVTRNNLNDVAYFRLKTEMLGVVPYDIYEPAAHDPNSMVGVRFNKVSAFNSRFKGHEVETSSISENLPIIQVGPVPSGSKNTMYISSVSSTKGNSGGGLFVDNPNSGRPEIFAVHSYQSLPSSDGLKFSSENYNMHPAIQGLIADMIRQEAARSYSASGN
jgi:hypothetical protein